MSLLSVFSQNPTIKPASLQPFPVIYKLFTETMNAKSVGKKDLPIILSLPHKSQHAVVLEIMNVNMCHNLGANCTDT